MSKKRQWTEAPEKSPVWIDPADKPPERLYLVADVLTCSSANWRNAADPSAG